MTPEGRLFELTRYDRGHLSKGRFTAPVRRKLSHLWLPYEAAFWQYTRRDSTAKQACLDATLWRSFHLCCQMMHDLDCTYWGFTWDRLLAWRADVQRREGARPAGWWTSWTGKWCEVTTTLFFLGALPYSDEIFRQNQRELADKWFGKANAQAIEDRFVAMTKGIGYRYENRHGREARPWSSLL
jgi:hypothetical protein